MLPNLGGPIRLVLSDPFLMLGVHERTEESKFRELRSLATPSRVSVLRHLPPGISYFELGDIGTAPLTKALGAEGKRFFGQPSLRRRQGERFDYPVSIGILLMFDCPFDQRWRQLIE